MNSSHFLSQLTLRREEGQIKPRQFDMVVREVFRTVSDERRRHVEARRLLTDIPGTHFFPGQMFFGKDFDSGNLHDRYGVSWWADSVKYPEDFAQLDGTIGRS